MRGSVFSRGWAERKQGFGFRQDDEGARGMRKGGASEPTTTDVEYSDEIVAELLYMIEEEKLAGDIYEAFHEMYGLPIFKNIAASEDRHFAAVVNQAEKMGVDVDEFLFQPAGTFVNEEVQELYDTLLAAGGVSVTGALEVGVTIEKKDMIDIAAAIEAAEGTRLAEVYENLLAGSANHLEAFEAALLT